jgi:predicted enzyme related to lactoylglutathione lyase
LKNRNILVKKNGRSISAFRALGRLRPAERAPANGSDRTTWENSVAPQRFAPAADRLGLYCVEIRTADWERSVRWYRETLGLKVLVRVTDDGYALLEMGTAGGGDVTPPKGHPEGFREIVTTDPDGNQIRLFSWPSRAG